MVWTYAPATLATTPKDQVRLVIGDTLDTEPQLQDEEILYLLTVRSSVYGAAAECCRSLQAKFSRSVDQGAGDQKILFSQMAKAYGVKAAEFESKAAMSGAGAPYAGGISVADKQNQQQDQDRVQPQFQIGMMDDFLPVAPTGNEASEPSDEGGP
jgi:hypothetical protein